MNSKLGQPLTGERDTGEAAPLQISLICPGENGPLPTEAFAQMLSHLVPTATIVAYPAIGDAKLTDGSVVVLVKNPSAALCWRITDGNNAPEQALADWREWADGLLRSHRRNRKNMLLVDSAILEPDMSAARTLLARRLGRDPVFAGNTGWVPEKGGTGEALNPLTNTIATAMLEDHSVADLVAELGSITIGMREPKDVLPLALSAWQQHANVADQSKLLTEHLSLRVKAQGKITAVQQTLEQQLASLRKEIEREKQEHKDEVALLQERSKLLSDNATFQIKAMNDLKGHVDQLQTRLDAVLDERAGLAVAKAEVEKRLDAALGERAGLVAAKTAVEQRRAYAQKRVDDLLMSRSWKMTAPIRAFIRLFNGRA